MLCPTCQSNISDGLLSHCPICSGPLPRQSSALRVVMIPPAPVTTPNVSESPNGALTCRVCQSPIKATDSACPVCYASLVQVRPMTVTLAVTSSSAPSSVRRTRQPVTTSVGTATFGEGQILGDPVVLQDEFRNREPLQVVVALLLLAEIILATVSISAFMMFTALALLFLGLVLQSRAGMAGFGCIGMVLIVPLRMVGLVLQPIREALDPRVDPANIRQVREYQLQLSQGQQDTFIVKGNMSPRTLRTGDTVRVWVTMRQGRPYFERGEQLNRNGEWESLRVAETRSGLRWLFTFLALNAVILYLFLTYTR